MNLSFLVTCLLALGVYSFVFGGYRIRKLSRQSALKQHSRDVYHASFLAACATLLPLLIVLVWSALSPLVLNALLKAQLQDLLGVLSTGEMGVLMAQTKANAAGILNPAFVRDEVQQATLYYQALVSTSQTGRAVLVGAVGLAGLAYGSRFLKVRFTARHSIEKLASWVMLFAAAVAILTTLGIVLSLLFETIRFFEKVSITEFLFGLQWSPQIAIREDQAGSSGAFGAIPLFAGTLMITLIAMLVAVPVGLMSAVYLSEYASLRLRNFAKPAIEVLAGIPTVVYGFFAALVLAPLLRDGGSDIGLTVSSESALAAGLVMGTMVIPFISSLSDDVINAVPQNLRDGAAALGATRSETITQVVLPAALPGIVSAVLLAVSRAIGETMIVVMAAGVAANLTANPFESVTTVTVQIVMLLVGDQEFDSAKTLAAFALGLLLFLLTLGLNILALYIVNKYREQYD